MSTNSKRLAPAQRYTALGAQLEKLIPSLWAVWNAEDEFIGMHVKARPDGSTLAVVKRYGADGGPVVLFGNGYGVAGAFMAADAAVQGDAWRVDKPWKGG